MVFNFILAWFVQMGIHEGAHAYAAKWAGDDTAELLGKKTFDPLKHINWTDMSSVLLGVVMPIMTAMQGIPMGMAWVPVNPLRFRKMRRDHAIVAFAGPLSNFILAAVLLAVNLITQSIFAGVAPLYVLSGIEKLLYAIYLTSIVYGVFNLVPLPPLDGSRVLYYFLPQNLRQVMDDIEPYGFWILILMFGFGGAGRLIQPFISAFVMLWHVLGA